MRKLRLREVSSLPKIRYLAQHGKKGLSHCSSTDHPRLMLTPQPHSFLWVSPELICIETGFLKYRSQNSEPGTAVALLNFHI